MLRRAKNRKNDSGEDFQFLCNLFESNCFIYHYSCILSTGIPNLLQAVTRLFGLSHLRINFCFVWNPSYLFITLLSPFWVNSWPSSLVWGSGFEDLGSGAHPKHNLEWKILYATKVNVSSRFALPLRCAVNMYFCLSLKRGGDLEGAWHTAHASGPKLWGVNKATSCGESREKDRVRWGGKQRQKFGHLFGWWGEAFYSVDWEFLGSPRWANDKWQTFNSELAKTAALQSKEQKVSICGRISSPRNVRCRGILFEASWYHHHLHFFHWNFNFIRRPVQVCSAVELLNALWSI